MKSQIAPLQQTTFPLTTDARDIDPGLLILAVSMMNLDSAYSTARNTLNHDDNIFQTLGKVAPLAGKTYAAVNQIVQKELQANNSYLAEFTGMQSRYADNVTVNEADNDRFRSLQKWAAERGITLEDSTKYITEKVIEYVEVEIEVEIEVPVDEEGGETSENSPSKSDREPDAKNLDPKYAGGDKSEISQLPAESGKGKTKVGENGESEPKTVKKTIKKTVTKEVEKSVTRLVADSEAIDRNIAKLQAYSGRLENRTADNAVLTAAINNDSTLAQVKQALAEEGMSLPFTSLAQIQQNISQLEHWTANLVATIEAHLATAKTVQTQIEKISVQLDDQKKDAVEVTENEEISTEQQEYIKKLEKFLELRKQQAPEMSKLLQKAISASENYLEAVKAEFGKDSVEAKDAENTVEEPADKFSYA